MNYIEIIDKINEELNASGVKSIYTLIANNIDVTTIATLMEKNTKEYNNLSKNQKDSLINYIKGLKLQSAVLLNF
jgi:hypothetical protein